ncbi:MAG TPA: hypothetical protein VFO95_13300 [Gemmatimonadales bacterium]|nr:hypothetical protein [Gemmatimonadales bacterium]
MRFSAAAVRAAGLSTLVAAGGCGERSPADPSVGEHPSFTFLNGPEDPGPAVLRSDDDTFIVLFNTDGASGLASVIRLPDPPEDVKQCGGSQPLQGADLQLVFHPDGVIQQLMIGNRVHAWVYDRQDFLAIANSSGVCAAFSTLTPLAHGLVDFVARDNDLFVSNTRTNAFGWIARGNLHLTSDGSAVEFVNRYHGAFRNGEVHGFFSSITMK